MTANPVVNVTCTHNSHRAPATKAKCEKRLRRLIGELAPLSDEWEAWHPHMKRGRRRPR